MRHSVTALDLVSLVASPCKSCRQLATAVRLSAFALALLAAGCDVEDPSQEGSEQQSFGDEQEPINESEQAFSSHGTWSLVAVAPSSIPLVSSATNTAFMTGLTGDLFTTNSAGISPGVSFPLRYDGTYLLKVDVAGPGRFVGGMATVVASVAGRTAGGTYMNTSPAGTTSAPSTDLGAITANRRCFLTQAQNMLPANNGFSAASDLLHIYQLNGHFWLGGSGRVFGGARCIDVTTHLGVVSWGGSATTDILDLGPAGGGKACFLTAIGGQFRGDSSNGVQVYLDGGTNHWVLRVSAGKTATAECNI